MAKLRQPASLVYIIVFDQLCDLKMISRRVRFLTRQAFQTIGSGSQLKLS